VISWRKSSFSDGDAGCVELAHVPVGIAIRDSKDPDGPILTVPQLGLLSPAVLQTVRAPSA
jgi:uncharacterized protein DUF397